MNLYKKIDVCTVCGSKKNKILYNMKGTDFADIQHWNEKLKHQKFKLLRCLNCSLVYLDPCPTQEASLDSWQYTLKIEGNEKIRNDLIYEDKLIEIEKKVSKGSILDIGCGLGYFLQIAKKREWQVEGIELSYDDAKFASNNGLNVKNGFFESVIYEKSKFDVITLFDVIEHVENPVNILKKCNFLLKSKGIIVIQTPDVDSLFRYIARKKRCFGLHHPNIFSQKSMSFALSLSGLKIKEIKYGNEGGILGIFRRSKYTNSFFDKIRYIVFEISRKLRFFGFHMGSKQYYIIKK